MCYTASKGPTIALFTSYLMFSCMLIVIRFGIFGGWMIDEGFLLKTNCIKEYGAHCDILPAYN